MSSPIPSAHNPQATPGNVFVEQGNPSYPEKISQIPYPQDKSGLTYYLLYFPFYAFFTHFHGLRYENVLIFELIGEIYKECILLSIQNV